MVECKIAQTLLGSMRSQKRLVQRYRHGNDVVLAATWMSFIMPAGGFMLALVSTASVQHLTNKSTTSHVCLLRLVNGEWQE